MAKDGRRMTMTYFKNQIDRGKKYVTVGDRNYFKKNGNYRWSEIEKRIIQDYEFVYRVPGTTGKDLSIILGSKNKQKKLIQNNGSGSHNVKSYNTDATALIWDYMIGRTKKERYANKDIRGYTDWQMTPKRWLIASGILSHSVKNEGRYKYAKSRYYYDKFFGNVEYNGAKQEAMKYSYWEFKERHFNELFKTVKRNLEKLISFEEVYVGSEPPSQDVLELWLKAFKSTFTFKDLDYELEKFNVELLCAKIHYRWHELSSEKIEQFLELTDIDHEQLTAEELKEQIRDFCYSKVQSLYKLIDKEAKRKKFYKYDRIELSHAEKQKIDELKSEFKINENPTNDWRYRLILHNRFGITIDWIEYEINLNQIIQHKNKYYFEFDEQKVHFPLDHELRSQLMKRMQLFWFEDFHKKNIDRVFNHLNICLVDFNNNERIYPDFEHNRMEYQLRKSGKAISYFWQEDLRHCDFVKHINVENITEYYSEKRDDFLNGDCMDIVSAFCDIEALFNELHLDLNIDFKIENDSIGE
ncbi:hypothetical protein ACFFRT_01790 [Enterococcus thailandicus]|uniref:Uncharacterized protein n=1 Tax=Enterococcus thailandicus TaxID=417368 RepID=A0A510WGB7_ENTTH|nr:hypothetical protein [Enterococcus thailandicus]GEK35820.1 hypothetical protein ETH01_01070 [Enterococcus thailandicus]